MRQNDRQDNFACHSDTLKKLKAKIGLNRNPPPLRGAPYVPHGHHPRSHSSQAPMSPRQPTMLPKRIGPGGGVGGGSGGGGGISSAPLAVAAQRTVSRPNRQPVLAPHTPSHSRTSSPSPSAPASLHASSTPLSHISAPVMHSLPQVQVLQDELREAACLIASLKEELSILETMKDDDIEALKKQHEEEFMELKSQIHEIEESAKQALTLREEHHAREKAEMLEVYNELQGRLRNETSAYSSAVVSYEQEREKAKEAEHSRSSMLADMHKSRDELRQARFKHALDGNQEYESLVRRLEVADEELRAAVAELSSEVQHSKTLMAKLEDLTIVHQSTLDELAMLQEEYRSNTQSHQKTLLTLQSTKKTVKDEASLDVQKYKQLLQKVKDTDVLEAQLRCEISVLQDELAFMRASKDDCEGVVEGLKDEVDMLKTTIHTMEEEWTDLLAVKEKSAEIVMRLKTSKQEAASLQLALDEARRVVENMKIDHGVLSNDLRIARQQVQELELVNAEHTEAFRRLRAAVPDLHRSLPDMVEHIVQVCRTEEALTEDLKQLRREHNDITDMLDTFHTQMSGDKKRAESTERHLRAEKEAHGTLQEDVQVTKQLVEVYEKKMQELELMVADACQARETAERKMEEIQQESRRLASHVQLVEQETEVKVREANLSKKKVLAKVSELRDEERWYNEQAMADLREAVERNKDQQRVMELMAGELKDVRRLLLEGVETAAAQTVHNSSIQEMVVGLKAYNAKCEHLYDETVVKLQMQVASLQSESNELRLHAKKSSDQLLAVREELRDGNHHKSQVDVQALLQQKRVTDNELETAAAQVKELRTQLHKTRESRIKAQEESSQLTAELCGARQEAQDQQRLLISEINALTAQAA